MRRLDKFFVAMFLRCRFLYFIVEIIGRVVAGTNPPFRPPLTANVTNEDLHFIMKLCWKEDPEDRPDFLEIRKMLRKLHGRK